MLANIRPESYIVPIHRCRSPGLQNVVLSALSRRSNYRKKILCTKPGQISCASWPDNKAGHDEAEQEQIHTYYLCKMCIQI